MRKGEIVMPDKSIRVIAHEACTGCGACYNRCPHGAITMQYDHEGFLYPQVSERCVNCGLCLSVCPVRFPVAHYPTPPAYAVWADDAIRLKSSSGGMFTLAAEQIFAQGGVVCGAVYAPDFQTVHHAWARNEEELGALRSSKYVQSDTQLTYRQTRDFLHNGQVVLYTGCPCQIAGLYNYLGSRSDNLYTIDLICHGSNSVFAYQSFLKEFTGNQPIEKVDFRDKRFFSWSTPTVVYLKNGNIKKVPWDQGTWYQGFLEGVINRLNCYQCPYACVERIADMTLGDCWQVHRINPSFDDRKGTSLVLVNSSQGSRLFNAAKPFMKLCEEIPLETIRRYNGQLNHPTPMHPSRKYFFSHLPRLGYHKALWYGRGQRFDVGLVGWWFASNYGSMLTYYALGRVLEDMGLQPILIPLTKIDDTPWEKETEKAISFQSKYFRVARTRDFDKMNEFNVFCDSFMLGSDQLFVADYLKLVGYTFFLDFVAKDKKKIAFATSFGSDEFTAGYEEKCAVADLLARFDAISVREISGVALCKEHFNLDVEQVLDPIFLCPREDYDQLAAQVHPHLPDGKYLLCYILDPTPEKEKAARAIAEHEGLEILTALDMKSYSKIKDQWHTGTVLGQISTEEFVHYVKNATFVLTDSHHGTCLSIIYQKPYAALVNAKRGSTRFETVARAFHLESRLRSDPLKLLDDERIYEPIDYDFVHKAMEREQARGMVWLREALKRPVTVADDTIHTAAVDNHRRTVGMTNRFNRQINALSKQIQATTELFEKRWQEIRPQAQKIEVISQQIKALTELLEKQTSEPPLSTQLPAVRTSSMPRHSTLFKKVYNAFKNVGRHIH